MKRGPVLALLVLLFAIGTWMTGWWAVPVIALGAGALLATWPTATRDTALAATLAWLLLLAWDATTHRLGVVAAMLGGIFPVSGVLVLGITLLFAAATGWSGAEVGGGLARMMQRRTHLADSVFRRQS